MFTSLIKKITLVTIMIMVFDQASSVCCQKCPDGLCPPPIQPGTPWQWVFSYFVTEYFSNFCYWVFEYFVIEYFQTLSFSIFVLHHWVCFSNFTLTIFKHHWVFWHFIIKFMEFMSGPIPVQWFSFHHWDPRLPPISLAVNIIQLC